MTDKEVFFFFSEVPDKEVFQKFNEGNNVSIRISELWKLEVLLLPGQ